MKRDKLNGLQILRGLAAWIVVFHHINVSYFNSNPPFEFLKIFNYGSFGVDIFFVLSGFIMYYSVKYNTRGGFSFLLDRLFRIFPVYWFMTALLAISSLILPVISYNTFFTHDTLLKSLLLIPHENPSGDGNYPFLYVGWTLTYEMFFYCVLSISLILYKKRALFLATTVLFILPFINHYGLLGHNTLLLYEFVAGVIIAFLYTRLKKSKYSYFFSKTDFIIILVIILLTSCILAIKVVGFSFPIKLLSASIIVFVFLLIENFIKNKSILSKLVLMGDISYSTYLIHPIILGWFKSLFMFTNNEIFKSLIILTFLYFVYSLSKLSYKLIEVNKWIFNIKKKLKNIFSPKAIRITTRN